MELLGRVYKVGEAGRAYTWEMHPRCGRRDCSGTLVKASKHRL